MPHPRRPICRPRHLFWARPHKPVEDVIPAFILVVFAAGNFYKTDFFCSNRASEGAPAQSRRLAAGRREKSWFPFFPLPALFPPPKLQRRTFDPTTNGDADFQGNPCKRCTSHTLFFQHLGVLLQNDPQLVELTLLPEHNTRAQGGQLWRSARRLHFIPGATLALTRQPQPFSPAGPLMYECPHSSATEADNRAHFIAGSRNPGRYFSSQ